MAELSFALVSIAGVSFGIALRLLLRSSRRGASPLSVRHKRIIGTPIATTAAVAAAGGAFLLSPQLLAGRWVAAVALAGAGAAAALVVLVFPRWWRLIPLLLLAAAVARPWMDRGIPLASCSRAELELRRDLSAGPGTVLALVRIVESEDGRLELRVAPVADLRAASPAEDSAVGDSPEFSSLSPGAWGSPLILPADGRLSMVLEIPRVDSLLWWGPRTAGGARLWLAEGEAADEGAALILEDVGKPARARGLLERMGLVRTVALRLEVPDEPGLFLQSGIRALEYHCR